MRRGKFCHYSQNFATEFRCATLAANAKPIISPSLSFEIRKDGGNFLTD
jgi:hypothetical protein